MSKQRQPRCGAEEREREQEGRAAIFQSFHRGLAGPRTNDREGGRLNKIGTLREFGTGKGKGMGGHLWFYRIRSKISLTLESTIFTSTIFCSTLFLLYRISSTIIVSTYISSK